MPKSSLQSAGSLLSSRSWKGEIWWKPFHRIKERFPLLRPKLYLPYAGLQAIAVL
jgi:hypothetical protein